MPANTTHLCPPFSLRWLAAIALIWVGGGVAQRCAAQTVTSGPSAADSSPASLRDYVTKNCPAVVKDVEDGKLGKLRTIASYQDDGQFFSELIYASNKLRGQPQAVLTAQRAEITLWKEKLGCVFEGISLHNRFIKSVGIDNTIEDVHFSAEYEIRAWEILIVALLKEAELKEPTWQNQLILMRKNFDTTLAYYAAQKKLRIGQRRDLYSLAKEYYRLRLQRVGVFHLVLRDSQTKKALPLAANSRKGKQSFLIQGSDGDWHNLDADDQLFFYLSIGNHKLMVKYPNYKSELKAVRVDNSAILQACERADDLYEGSLLTYIEIFDRLSKKVANFLKPAAGAPINYDDPALAGLLDEWKERLTRANNCVARAENLEFTLEILPWCQRPVGAGVLSALAGAASLIVTPIVFTAVRPPIVGIK